MFCCCCGRSSHFCCFWPKNSPAGSRAAKRRGVNMFNCEQRDCLQMLLFTFLFFLKFFLSATGLHLYYAFNIVLLFFGYFFVVQWRVTHFCVHVLLCLSLWMPTGDNAFCSTCMSWLGGSRTCHVLSGLTACRRWGRYSYGGLFFSAVAVWLSNYRSSVRFGSWNYDWK